MHQAEKGRAGEVEKAGQHESIYVIVQRRLDPSISGRERAAEIDDFGKTVTADGSSAELADDLVERIDRGRKRHQMRSGLGAFADAQPVDVESGVAGGQCRANVRMHVGVFGPIPIIMIVGRAMHEKLNRARRPTLRDA